MPVDFVLIVEFTTPLQYELILGSIGIVSERGGLTSHAANLARELGKPCVVGVVGALQKVPAGVQVTVDGDKGSVVWTSQ